MIEIQFDDNQALNALNELLKATGDLTPALKEIGEHLTESSKQRFADQAGPDGQHWKPNKPSTTARKGNKPPLTGETGLLGDTINYQLTGNDTLEIGSPMEYAAMQQFGGSKQEFPWLWGDIPARPFLGVSDDDGQEVLDIINDHLTASLK